jgi:AcrR family transcriptional regulator
VGNSEQPDLREGILRVSLQLGTELGAEGLTMRAIAKRLGVSATALYQHFESKSAILRAIRFEGVGRLHAMLAPAFEHDDPLRRLAEQGVRYIQFARDNPWLYSILVDDEEEDWATMTEAERDRGTESHRRVVQAFRDGIDRGVIRGDTDIGVAPIMLWAALHGMASLILRGRIREEHPQFPMKDADAMVRSYVDSVLRGFKA